MFNIQVSHDEHLKTGGVLILCSERESGTWQLQVEQNSSSEMEVVRYV
jgi:hypothetical protein